MSPRFPHDISVFFENYSNRTPIIEVCRAMHNVPHQQSATRPVWRAWLLLAASLTRQRSQKVALFLASDASSFMRGAEIFADSGAAQI
jgi:enoyl-[acyl-carrier-protein] reductase (NADH)